MNVNVNALARVEIAKLYFRLRDLIKKRLELLHERIAYGTITEEDALKEVAKIYSLLAELKKTKDFPTESDIEEYVRYYTQQKDKH